MTGIEPDERAVTIDGLLLTPAPHRHRLGKVRAGLAGRRAALPARVQSGAGGRGPRINRPTPRSVCRGDPLPAPGVGRPESPRHTGGPRTPRPMRVDDRVDLPARRPGHRPPATTAYILGDHRRVGPSVCGRGRRDSRSNWFRGLIRQAVDDGGLSARRGRRRPKSVGDDDCQEAVITHPSSARCRLISTSRARAAVRPCGWV